MDGQGHPSQDYSWMCVAVEEILQALQGAGPSPPRPHNSSVANNAGLFPRAPTADVTSANGEATTADNHAEPRRPPTEEMPLLFAGLVGPRRVPPEGHAAPGTPAYRPHRAAGAPPEVAPLDGKDEEEVPRDHRFGPLRVNLTPPRPRDTSPGDRAPSADAEEAWNQAIALSDDWVDFDGLVEDTLGDLFNSPPHTEPPATGALGPLGAVYDLVSDDEGRPRGHYNPTGDDGDDSDATVLYDPTAEDSRDIRRRRTPPPHPSDNRAPPYMGEVEAALVECFGEMPGDDFNWGSGTNTASTISADEDEEGRPSDASRPPYAGPAEDASSSTVSADEGEASQDSDWSYAPRSPPPRWTPPAAKLGTSRSKSPPTPSALLRGDFRPGIVPRSARCRPMRSGGRQSRSATPPAHRRGAGRRRGAPQGRRPYSTPPNPRAPGDTAETNNPDPGGGGEPALQGPN
nr:basic salivary proline-rich protein 1-like [Drosophila kikkawai]